MSFLRWKHDMYRILIYDLADLFSRFINSQIRQQSENILLTGICVLNSMSNTIS